MRLTFWLDELHAKSDIGIVHRVMFDVLLDSKPGQDILVVHCAGVGNIFVRQDHAGLRIRHGGPLQVSL